MNTTTTTTTKTKEIFPWNVKVGQTVPITGPHGQIWTAKVVGITKRRGQTMAGNVWDIRVDHKMFPVLSYWGKVWYNGHQYHAEKVVVIAE